MNMLLYQTSTGTLTEELIRVPGSDEVAWVRMVSPTPDEVNQVLGSLFNCHPLLVEDAIKLNQRPKMDKYKHNFFVTFFAIQKDLKPIDLGIAIGDNYVITVSHESISIVEHLYEECK